MFCRFALGLCRSVSTIAPIIATMIAILGHIGHTVMDLTERDERFRSMRDDPGSQGAELRDLLE